MFTFCMCTSCMQGNHYSSIHSISFEILVVEGACFDVLKIDMCR